jgi:hypothetical protein
MTLPTTMTTTPASASRTRGPGSSLLLGLGLVLAVLAIASGTYDVVGLWWLRSDTTTTDLGQANTLRVRQDCGDVTVRQGTGDRVILTSKRWMALSKPTVSVQGESVDGPNASSTLSVTGKCPSFGGGFNGSLALTFVVPAGTTLDVSSSGGNVHLLSVDGSVTAHSSAGSVRGEDLHATSIVASSSAGDVSLSFAGDPTTVDASSSAGSVRVEVPKDGTAYALNASTSAGRTFIGIATDPNSSRHIRAKSSAGNVDVDWR